LGLDLVLLIANCCLLIALFSVVKEPAPGFPITGSSDHQIARSLGFPQITNVGNPSNFGNRKVFFRRLNADCCALIASLFSNN
jgi:hypothetical protein